MESSGNTMTSTPCPSACAIRDSIWRRLYWQSATWTVGTAAATFMKPYCIVVCIIELSYCYLCGTVAVLLERGILIGIALVAVVKVVDQRAAQHTLALAMDEDNLLSFLVLV